MEKLFEVLDECFETNKVEISGFYPVDCMVSADWAHGEIPCISIAIDESDGEDNNSVEHEAQLEIEFPRLIEAFIRSFAYGEVTSDKNQEDHMPFAYDAMISYLEYMQKYLKERKELYIFNNTNAGSRNAN